MTTRRYRILHTEASLGWGGQEIRVLTEAAKFAEEGHVVHLVCDPDSDIFAEAPRYGIERTAIAMKKKSLGGLMALRGFFRSWRPDVVNPHSSIDHWLSAAARLRLSPRPAIVRTRHISAPVSRGPATRWLYNRGADHLMATSHSIVESLVEDGFLPSGRAAAVPTGIDTAVFSAGDRDAARAALGLPETAFIFVIVATLRSWKGHAFLLEALQRLDADVVALIVGDGPQEENLRRQVVELGVEDRVVFAGRQTDVLPYLHSADAFVLPSYANEGVPQAMLQAMACGLPVVACPVGGIPELADGLSGVSFAEPKNAQSLCDAMQAMMTRPKAVAEREALRARISLNFSRDGMYRKALTVFEDAIGRV